MNNKNKENMHQYKTLLDELESNAKTIKKLQDRNEAISDAVAGVEMLTIGSSAMPHKRNPVSSDRHVLPNDPRKKARVIINRGLSGKILDLLSDGGARPVKVITQKIFGRKFTQKQKTAVSKLLSAMKRKGQIKRIDNGVYMGQRPLNVSEGDYEKD